jgi:hypothetical protein
VEWSCAVEEFRVGNHIKSKELHDETWISLPLIRDRFGSFRGGTAD